MGLNEYYNVYWWLLKCVWVGAVMGMDGFWWVYDGVAGW